MAVYTDEASGVPSGAGNGEVLLSDGAGNTDSTPDLVFDDATDTLALTDATSRLVVGGSVASADASSLGEFKSVALAATRQVLISNTGSTGTARLHLTGNSGALTIDQNSASVAGNQFGTAKADSCLLRAAPGTFFGIGTLTATPMRLGTNDATRMLFAGTGSVQFTTGVRFPITAAKTGAYTVTLDDFTVPCDATSGAFDVTLPIATGNSGQVFIVKKIDASGNAVTVKTAGGTIDGVAAGTGIALPARWDTLTVQSDGTNYLILAPSV